MTSAIGIPTTAAPAGGGASSLIGSTSAALAVSNAPPAFTMPSSGAPTAAAAAAVTASPGFSTSNLFKTPSSVASTASAASSSPFSTTTTSALSNTTASITQMTAPASTSSSATTSGRLSNHVPAKPPVFSRLGGATGPLSNRAPPKPHVFSRLGEANASASTTTGPVLSVSTAPATATTTVTTGIPSSPAPAKPVFSTVTTTVPASPAPGLFSSQAATSASSIPSITTLKQETVLVVVKAPDFYDFNKDRSEECFAVDQIWAIYDDLDFMPRDYVRINKVYSPFKVDVTWLEFVAEGVNETSWKKSGLPVACGKFKYKKSQKTDIIEDMSSFSYKVFKSKKVHESYNIYPRKEETWALYKNWNNKWSSHPDNHREYEYEFVVVLSDYTKNSGILVARLVKLKGFVCLFKPIKDNGIMASFQIPFNEFIRFSHRVPSFRTNGKERKDVIPEGYFELDTCSLPSNLEEMPEVVDMKAETVDRNINGLLKFVSEEKHPMPKKRKSPDANGCYKNSNEKKRAAEASGRPLDKSKDIIVSIGGKNAAAHPKEMGPDGMITIPGSEDQGIPSSPSSLKFFETTASCSSAPPAFRFPTTPPKFFFPSFGAAPSTSSAMPNTPTAAAAAPFSTTFLTTAATSSSPFRTTTTSAFSFGTGSAFSFRTGSAFSFGTGSALSNTTACFTQTTTAPASVAPAATSPSCTPFRFDGATGRLSNPAPAKPPVFSGFEGATGFTSKVTTMGPLLSASTAPATNTGAVMTGFGGATGFTPTVNTTTFASPVFTMASFGAPAAAAAASPGFSTSNLFKTPSSVASTTSVVTTAAAPLSSPFLSTASSSSPFSTTKTSAFTFGTGPLSNTTTSFTQITAPASTTSSTFSFGTPSSSPFRFGGATGPLSCPTPTKLPVFSGFGGPTGFTSTVTATGPLLSASTAPATPASALTTGLHSNPAPAKPVFSGSGGATNYKSTVTTTTPAFPAPGLFSLQAATSTGFTPSITTPKQEPELVILKVAYPDFYDFDKSRSEECFEVNQKWAIFDSLDLMPRNYVRIDKLYSPFKVDVTWMEFVDENIEETAWKRSGLPVACGKFKYGKTDTIEDMSSFSHRIFKNKSVHESCVYPRQGETWALYKNWNIKWSSDPDNHGEYEYEFVLVLSDYTKNSGILVVPLVKLKGFVCLFKRIEPIKKNGMASFRIPSNELLRFSHRVPSFRTNGEERKDVPEGYFELDTCSLPSNLEEVSGVIDMAAETVSCNINGSLKSVSTEKHPMPKKRKNPDAESTLDRISPGGNKASRMSNVCYKNSNEEKRAAEASGRPLDKSKAIIVSVGGKTAAANPKEMCPDGMITIPGGVDQDIPSSPCSLKIFEMLDTGFCNFDEERSYQKFKTGQIWAIYCKWDKFPKNYAQIVSVESFPVFKLAVKCLEFCDPPRGIIPWVDKEMPVSCGTFKVTSSEVVVFSDSVSFSHQLSEVPPVNNVYTIYPRVGEVWALYSKFRFDLTCSELNKCEYDFVEILEVVDARWIIVSVFERVTGFKTVFKAKEKEELDSTAAIPWIELCRFSHKVPASMLSGARYGKLRGCWELDPRSVVVY